MTRYPENTLGIADTIHELVRQYGSVVPTYQSVLTLIASARLPAFRHGGRWRINVDDLPRIAEILKLTDRAA